MKHFKIKVGAKMTCSSGYVIPMSVKADMHIRK